MSPQVQAGFGVSLGIEFHKLYPIGCEKGNKGDKMLFGHGVVDGDKLLVFHLFNVDVVMVVGVFRFQRRQGDTATTDKGVAGGADDVAA